jgi:conjugal transfer pilus assembly protein TrbC
MPATMTSEGMGEAPRFIAFASLSMPPARCGDDRRRGQAPAASSCARVAWQQRQGSDGRIGKSREAGEQLDGVGIDPRLFRAFGIEAVPTYVVTSSDFDLCDGFDCRTRGPAARPDERQCQRSLRARDLRARRRPRRFARGPAPRPS